MARNRNTRQGNSKTGCGCAVIALLLVVGGCTKLLGIGDDDEQKTSDCAMELTVGTGPKGWIGGGHGGGGGGGFTSGGGSSSGGSGGSSGGSTGSSGGLGDTDTPDYQPGMDPDDVSAGSRAAAEAEHGDLRRVGTDWIWFDKRTNKPFPWHKKAYAKAKRAAKQADEAEKALEASEKDC